MACENYCVHGMDRCGTHLGQNGRNEARIEKVLKVANDMKNLREGKFGQRHDIGPGEALLLLVQHKSAEVEYWREKVIALEDIVGMRVVEETDSDGTGTFGDTTQHTEKKQETIHPWYKLLRDAERDLSTYAQAALRAGVEERLVRASEQVGVQMLGVLNEFVGSLDLDAARLAKAQQTIPTLLRALPTPSRAAQV